MALWFLRELRALRGKKSFFIKCKEFTTKTLIYGAKAENGCLTKIIKK
jgi:hypothetical protein